MSFALNVARDSTEPATDADIIDRPPRHHRNLRIAASTRCAAASQLLDHRFAFQ
jgi:hypothetical protein